MQVVLLDMINSILYSSPPTYFRVRTENTDLPTAEANHVQIHQSQRDISPSAVYAVPCCMPRTKTSIHGNSGISINTSVDATPMTAAVGLHPVAAASSCGASTPARSCKPGNAREWVWGQGCPSRQAPTSRQPTRCFLKSPRRRPSGRGWAAAQTDPGAPS